MKYGSTTLATDWKTLDRREKLFIKTLFFIPRANPHAEPLYPRVKKWLLEIDDDGNAVREVAVDTDGIELFHMPSEQDYGFWTDSNVIFTNDNLIPITSNEFEEAWKRAQKLIPNTINKI